MNNLQKTLMVVLLALAAQVKADGDVTGNTENQPAPVRATAQTPTSPAVTLPAAPAVPAPATTPIAPKGIKYTLVKDLHTLTALVAVAMQTVEGWTLKATDFVGTPLSWAIEKAWPITTDATTQAVTSTQVFGIPVQTAITRLAVWTTLVSAIAYAYNAATSEDEDDYENIGMIKVN
ncbi:MAG TPA: hypothetical protein VEK38_04610 [Candidatus Bathyarchaeia archaeon]|nr:hypothetical protein [Candidatus Bathyarchaeia archaeon]